MTKIVPISAKEWQKLVDLHEKLGPVLLETVGLLHYVAIKSNVPSVATDAARILAKLEPVAKHVVAEHVPFGTEKKH